MTYLYSDVPYPVVQYRVYLKRKSKDYYLNYFAPMIMITLISFTVFHMSFEVGERLGFGITTLLTIELIKSTLTTLLPTCGEILWVSMFLFVHIIFTAIPLLVSCLVLSFSFVENITFFDEVEAAKDEALDLLKAATHALAHPAQTAAALKRGCCFGRARTDGIRPDEAEQAPAPASHPEEDPGEEELGGAAPPESLLLGGLSRRRRMRQKANAMIFVSAAEALVRTRQAEAPPEGDVPAAANIGDTLRKSHLMRKKM